LKDLLGAKDRDVKLRYITEITTENIPHCRELMIFRSSTLGWNQGHFMVSEREYLAPVVLNNSSGIASQIIYSNLHEIVEQQAYIFDTLWNKAIPGIKRIEDRNYL